MFHLPGGSIPVIVDRLSIADDLDDTLNNFTETLQRGEFPYDPADSLSADTYERYLRKIRAGESDAGDLLSTEYSYCRFKVHLQCWQQARARPDTVEFMQWLRRNRWRIIVCTQRDLRRAHDCTKAWLEENKVPFDYLFMAANKIDFCKAWRIPHLVDETYLESVHGNHPDVSVYYAANPEVQPVSVPNAFAFRTFDEVKEWICE